MCDFEKFPFAAKNKHKVPSDMQMCTQHRDQVLAEAFLAAVYHHSSGSCACPNDCQG